MLDLSHTQSNVLNSTETQRIFVALSISVAKTGVTVRLKKDTYPLLQSINTFVYRCNILIRPHFSSTRKRHTQIPFVYVPGLHSTSFRMYCATQGHTGMEQLFAFA